MNKKYALLLGFAMTMGYQGLHAQTPTDSAKTAMPPTDESVFEMSLEDLLNVEVTSVSKKAEKLQNVASSIYVLSKEDIMRSGATNFIELLRQVPGFWGTQEEYGNGTGSMRYAAPENGFIGSVLYLLDGTPIQELMSATVSFRNLDLPLDEIERIEIIKGSGGTVYGANSATGVVNIFTKDPSKYDNKLTMRAERATPGYFVASVRGGGKITEKLSLSAYAKVRDFSGYGLMKEFDGDFVEVPKNDGSGNTVILNRFSANYEHQQMISGGLKANYDISEKTKLSFRSHLNTLFKDHEYSNSYPPEWFATQRDLLHDKQVRTFRITSNLRVDHTFNDKHSIFFRVSTNQETDYVRLGGGYDTHNGIFDLELQDNLKLGMNDLIFGINYRAVNFKVDDIHDDETINYVDPNARESIKGVFAQDKLSFFNGKLNATLGLKAEQYTLVNDNFYLSPSFKLSYIPTEKLTFWGGFTQSYTTPGFNTTNIDLTLLKAPSYPFFYGQIQPKVKDGVYQGVYQGAINAGADATTAAAQANAFINSPQGQATIAQTTDAQTNAVASQYPGYYSVGVKNGSKTVPTRFQTFEFGVRSTNISKVSLETNFFYTILSDGIIASDGTIFKASPSLTQPGQRVDYYAYGNYLKGTSVGNETVAKGKLLSFLTLEGSYTLLKTTAEYQKNSDFDVDKVPAEKRKKTLGDPTLPQSIWRFKAYLDLPKDFYITGSLIYATKTNTDAQYQFDNQRYIPVLGGKGQTIARNSDRTILNFKVEKKFDDKKLSVYVFGNDILNTKGIIEATSAVTNVTLSQIKAMYGIGASYNF